MTMLAHYVAAKSGVVGLTKALAAPGTIRPTDEHGSCMLSAAVTAAGLDPQAVYQDGGQATK